MDFRCLFHKSPQQRVAQDTQNFFKRMSFDVVSDKVTNVLYVKTFSVASFCSNFGLKNHYIHLQKALFLAILKVSFCDKVSYHLFCLLLVRLSKKHKRNLISAFIHLTYK